METIKIFTLIFFFLVINQIFGQIAPDKYWVQFKDKTNSPYSVENPSQYLSQRAIQRRTTQNIAIVENDLPVNPSYLTEIINLGAQILTTSKWFNGATVFTTNQNVVSAIQNLPFVQSVSKYYAKNKESANFPDKFKINEGKSIIENNSDKSIDYGNAWTQIHMLNGDYLHNAGFMGQGMIISIIDAGFNGADTLSAFDSLWQNNNIIGWRDFVNKQNNLFAYTHTHGMNVLSILAGNIPGQILGSAPKASYWLLRSEDAATEYLVEEYNWASAAEFADSAGTDVINTSLGYSDFTDPAQNHSYSDMNGHTTPIARAVNIAFSKGMLIVISAGNSGNSAWHYITTPGDADDALTVGAVDSGENYAAFSSVGPASDGDMKPNVSAMGSGTCYVGTDNFVHYGNGTSFSAPLITGLATCLWQSNPNYTNLQIKLAIEQSASQYLNPDYELGYGIPNFSIAFLSLNTRKYNTEKLISTFPNPFANVLAIEFYSPDSQQVKIEIINLLGTVVFSKFYNFQNSSYNKFVLNSLDNLSQGTYILKTTTTKNIFQQKIIKGKK